MKIATIKDIASEAGVAKSTVSRVLNNSGYVQKDTREKIEAIMKMLNYSPSATARNLSRQESSTIGVIIPEADNPFFGEILQGISNIADKNNLTIIFCNTSLNAKKEVRALKMLKEQRIKGLILTPLTYYKDIRMKSDLIHLVNDLNIPIVLLDRAIDGVKWDGVYIDNFIGAFQAVNALIKEGHTKIGIITGDLNLKIGQERFEGYQRALQNSGITMREKYIFRGDFSTDTAYKLANKCLEMKDRPTAIFTCNNLTNLGFLKAVFEKKMNIPRDISYIGFDKISVLDILNIKFSTVDRDTIMMGETAMQLLLGRLAFPKKEQQHIILSPSLILTGSEKKY